MQGLTPVYAAVAIHGTLVNLASCGGTRSAVRFGHPSGTLRVEAGATQSKGEWVVKKTHHEPQRTGIDGGLGDGAGRLNPMT